LADTNTQSPDCRPIGQSPHVQIRHDGRDLSAYFGAFVYHPESPYYSMTSSTVASRPARTVNAKRFGGLKVHDKIEVSGLRGWV
jgi:hypothetical protein